MSSRPLPEGTPDDVVHVSGGPAALYERLRGDDLGGDVELLGGPSLIRAFWQRGWVDVLGLVVLPVTLPDGSMELYYECA